MSEELTIGQVNFETSQDAKDLLAQISPLTTLGDLAFFSTENDRLAGNISATKKFLSQLGNGAISAAPVWDTVAKADVGLGNVENTALSTWAGSSSLTTLGTIATGVWSGTAIGPTKGGTGLTSFTTGDLLYASAANTLSKLPLGTALQVLQVNAGGTQVEWAASGSGVSLAQVQAAVLSF